MKGRRPKPAGMSTRRPTRSDSLAARLPSCPSQLQGEARKEWKRIGRKLLACGLMTEIDGTTLALYCTAWARWVEAEANLLKYGTVIKAPSGYPMGSPYLAIANKAIEQMTRLLVEFGMSPSSRSRVSFASPPSAPLHEPDHHPGDDPRLIVRRQAG